MSATSVPRSGFDQVGGFNFFARMLDKIRLHARGELRPEYHANLGKGADIWCCNFLHVDYAALRQRVLEGGTDEEILEWCYGQNRRLNETELMVWNEFTTKFGTNDFASPRLAEVKQQSGLAHREDIQTMMHYFDVDEGRKP